MFNWLAKILTEKHNSGLANRCKDCVWHKSEEECNVKQKKHMRYCSVLQMYTFDYNTCVDFKEEWFEAKPGATETEEIIIDFNVSVEPTEIKPETTSL
jgi:hypothetical protein